jgi:hypothetical protein
MSSQTISILIEGLPYCLGTVKPSWYAGTLDSGLVEYPQIRQTMDCLGGIARFDEVEIDVLDPSTRWARLLRVVQPTEYYAISPNPIAHDTTTITMRSATGISVGNILYAEQDTWTVTDISGAPDIVVTRQTYTCLEDGWNCRYQTDYWTDYTVIVSPDGPPSVIGRMVAIYVDGVLEFLGRVVDLSQAGRSWRMRFRSILDVLAESINPPNVGLRLRHDWNYGTAKYQIGELEYVCTASSGRGGTVEQMLGDWAIGNDAPAQNSLANGWQWVGSDDIPTNEPPDILDSAMTHGAVSALGSEWILKSLVGYCTKPLGVERYGVMVGFLGGEVDYLEASELHNDGTAYVLDHLPGQWLKVGDQFAFVTQVDTVNGRVYLAYFTEIGTGSIYRWVSCGFASTSPIELSVAPYVTANNLQDAATNTLTGTGALGMGLPSSLISDEPCVPIGGISGVRWDWSQGGIDEDLRARGVALVLSGGLVGLRRVVPPIEAASTATINQADLLQGDVPAVARGHEAPVAAITYATRSDDLTISWSASTGPGRATVRTVKWTSNTKDGITDYVAWAQLQVARLRWLYPGTPTITIRLIADTLQIGQVVTLSSRYVADGSYLTHDLPALVIERDPVSAEYRLALNIGPQIGACWAFSIEVSSVDGAVVTPTNQADLAAFASIVPVGTEVQITEHDQTSVLWYGTIASYQATTVTLSSAPTIAADEIAILTCEDVLGTTYGALVERQVYAADASGLIDSTYPAKVLI